MSSSLPASCAGHAGARGPGVHRLPRGEAHGFRLRLGAVSPRVQPQVPRGHRAFSSAALAHELGSVP